MDANGARFHLLADAAVWRVRSHLAWHTACRSLVLASERALDAPVSDAAFNAANSAIEAIPRAVDALGAVARWHEGEQAVVVRSHLPGDVLRLPLPLAPSDLAVSDDGVLHVVQGDELLLHDLRGRFADARVALEGFAPWRLAAAGQGGGVWLLDRIAARVAWLDGRPMPLTTPERDQYDPHTFRPEPENCRPPRLVPLPAPPLLEGERVLAIAAQAEAGLVLLSWQVDGQAFVRRWVSPAGSNAVPGTAGSDATQGRWSAALALDGARYAYSLEWLDAARIAVRLPARRDAPAFDLTAQAGTTDDDLVRRPLGDVYPLADDAQEAPFAHRVDGEPRVPTGSATVAALLPLSLRQLARRGEARHWRFEASLDGDVLDAHLIDSGDPATVWHRLYAEASIPAGCGFIAWLAATAEPTPPADDDAAWQAHAFGDDLLPLAGDALTRETPRAVWERAASEVPGHPGLATWTRERGRRGLFQVLIQHGGRAVRRVVGRYLWLRLELFGDGRASPEIVALRAWAPRFDLVEQYLPRLYRESVFGAEAQAPGEPLGRLALEHAAALDAGTLDDGLRTALAQSSISLSPAAHVRVEETGRRWRVHDDTRGASWPVQRETQLDGATEVATLVPYRPRATPADFMSRWVANVEGVFTTLEDRVAAAHLLTDPAVAPEAQLDWLGSWIGVAFDGALPAARRREWLAAAPALARWHGTRRGLGMALDVATGGAVRGGEIVVIEDFRLRRLLATLLGVQLDREDDPLLPGASRSGNSVVGDTLVLGDAERVELLALFDESVTSDAEDAAVRDFFGRLAHRVTVLVHREVDAVDLGLVRRIAALEAPAHVQVRVASATWPFLVGVASLVGVDSYLGPPRPRRTARVQVSSLGLGDVVQAPAALDPRLAGVTATPLASALAGSQPVADAGADRSVAAGASFTLDASGSRAAPGRRLERFVWRLLPPGD